jgi:hypothetical protein
MRKLPLLALLGFAGCFHNGGAGNQPAFAFDNGGSLDDNNVAAGGAHTTIAINGIDFAGVRSSNSSVATFTKNGTKVEVESGQAGTAALELTDSGGGTLASATVTVENTAVLKTNLSSAKPQLLEGSTQIFHVITTGAQGNVTKGDGSVQFQLSGTLTADVAKVDGDAVSFTGTAGDGSIRATCPNVTLDQPFSVVAESAIQNLDMLGTVEPNDTAVVTVVPKSAAGGVYTGACAWKVSDPSVWLTSEVAPTLDLGPGTLAVFSLTRPGTFSISCTLAGQTATVQVSR